MASEAAAGPVGMRDQALIERLPAITYISGREAGVTLYVSPQIQQILGYSPAQWGNGSDLWHKSLHPADRERVIAEAERVRRDHSSFACEYRLFAADGRVVWIRDDSLGQWDAQGQLVSYQGVMFDITPYKQAVGLQAALYRIADETLRVEDVSQLYRAIHNIIGELIDARNFYIALYDPATDQLTFPYYADEYEVLPQDPVPPGNGPTNYVIRTGQPLLAPQEMFLAAALHEIQPIGLLPVDWLGVPLKRGEETFGVLAVQSHDHRTRFDERDRDLLTFVAQHIAIALERKRAQDELQASEERYRNLVENAPIGIYQTMPGPDGEFLTANQTALAMFGCGSLAQLRAKPPWAYYADPRERLGFLEAVLRQGNVKGLEYRLVKADGTPMWGSLVARLVRGPDGAALGIDCMLEDITERKRAEATEREQRAFAEALRDTAAALASTLSYDEVLDRILTEVGRVVSHDSANIMLLEDGQARVVRVRGYEQYGAEPVSGLVFAVSHTANLRKVVETGLPMAIPDTAADPDWIPVSAVGWIRSHACAPIRSQGKIVGFLSVDSAVPGFFGQVHADRLRSFADQAGLAIENARLYHQIRSYASDLEARVAQRTAELQAANQRLKELDRLKDEFISHVSHELRTPLANIKLYLSLLERGKADKQGWYMATLQSEVNLLHRLIEQVLDLSSLDVDREPVLLQAQDVNQVLLALVREQRPLVERRGLTLQLEQGHDLPPAMARPKMLMQVLANLIANAANYTPAGGRITLRSGQDRQLGRHWVFVAVSDTGPGLSDEDRQHLFERFYRGRSARASSMPGTGLGLAICREIVDRLGGRLTVDSQLGRGSTFTVWLTTDSVASDG